MISRDIRMYCGRFVGPSPSQYMDGSPCFIKRREERERKTEKFYIYSDVTHTHTHPAGAWSTMKGKRKEKADTDDGQKARTAQEGEGNERTSKPHLRGETDLTKTEHTPKPHDTLRRSTVEELGTEWGLVGDERETTKII